VNDRIQIFGHNSHGLRCLYGSVSLFGRQIVRTSFVDE
jgi:hypothetical protein